MIRVSAVRFFLAAAPAPGWYRAALAATAIASLATLWLNPADVDSAYGGVLLLQMFGTSSGFAGEASRGHFDPLLVGASRRRTALAHFVASALPGAVAWAAVAAAACALGSAGEALAPSRVAGLVVISSIAWASGLPLPRLTAGALWSLVLVALAMSRWFSGVLSMVQAPPSTYADVAAAAAACVACPFLLLSRFAAVSDARVIALCFAAAALALAAGAAYVIRRDYPLVEPA